MTYRLGERIVYPDETLKPGETLYVWLDKGEKSPFPADELYSEKHSGVRILKGTVPTSLQKI